MAMMNRTDIQIRVVPGFLGIQKTPVHGKHVDPPASERLVIQQGIVEIPFVRQFFQRLVTDEIQAAHSLVDPGK
jgi:hypothetical protein